jgi:DNA modification methylase
VTEQNRAAVRILPTVTDPDFVLYIGDVREVLGELEDESVHCVVTSPPYWGLRDYGTGLWEGGDPDCDHSPEQRGGRFATSVSAKQASNTGSGTISQRDCPCGARRVDQQLGLEPSPDQYIQNMVAVFREVRRVLRRDGTLWLNIGDSYNNRVVRRQSSHQEGLGFASEDLSKSWREQAADGRARMSIEDGTLKEKDLCGIPWRLAFALQQDGWYLRAEIIWAKPNPMPESVTDRPTKAHEQVFLLTRSPRYFYDADAVREDYTPDDRKKRIHDHRVDGGHENYAGMTNGRERWAHSGRNLRSVWEIPTEPFPQAHFATYPQALVERCIKAGTSEQGCCPECGAPWERETETQSTQHRSNWAGENRGNGVVSGGGHVGRHGAFESRRQTLGWKPSCDCGKPWWRTERWRDYEPVACTVFDPFIGSGTTALVARRLGRHCVGIELSPEYAQICLERTRQLSLLAT